MRVQSRIDLDDSRPVLDLVWLRLGRYARQHPQTGGVLILIEVADSTVAFDMGEQAVLYAQSNIVEYWVVDIQNCCVHVHVDSDKNAYRAVEHFEIGDRLSPTCKPDALLDLAELFLEG